MSINITQVDAFTGKPFSGNPAAVCLLPEPRDEGWMQRVAAEMNLSETAFLVRREDGFLLRWFTPAVEVDLCGHATLASAHVLWEEGHLKADEKARFHTRSGVLLARRFAEWIELDFPAQPEQQVDAPDGLVDSLGVEAAYIGRNQSDYLVMIESADKLRTLNPSFSSLQCVPARGIIVTSVSDNPEFHFMSRFFAPASGINEDPVTGSAHCCLGPFWGERLGKTEMVAFQASARGGVVRVRLGGERVFLSGQAVTVLRGTLLY